MTAFEEFPDENVAANTNVLAELAANSADSFDTNISDITTNRLDVPGTYNFNIERHRFIDDLNTGGGTFIKDIADTDNLDDSGGKFQVTAQPGEEHVFGTRERLRYVPNYELLWGAAAWAESELTAGQHFAIEFMDMGAENGYRYKYDGGEDFTLTLEQFSGGSVVNSLVADLSKFDQQKADTDFDIRRPLLHRAYTNWYGAGQCRYTLSYLYDNNGVIEEQRNSTIGRTGNVDDVSTDEINNRVQVRVWADGGADPLTVNICSFGAAVRGNATQVDREKVAILWNVGGSISQYPVDNVDDAIAARIDPNRPEVVVNMTPPIFQPAGSGVIMELAAYGIRLDDPDFTANFDDPDDDGADEGPSPAAQSRGQTDVMQYTRDVTSIPTTTDIRADGTTGLVPDMRQLTITVGESGTGTNPGTTSSGEAVVKRTVHSEEAIVFLPRTDPTGNTTSGTIRYLKPVWEQDW